MNHSKTKKIISVIILISLFLSTPLTVSVFAANSKVKSIDPYANPEYYKVVKSIVKEYGICHDDVYNSTGLAFVDLIDFDKNGSYELYVVYLKELTSCVVTQEIWGMKNGKAINVFSEDYNGVGRVWDRSLSICRNKSKVYIKYNSSFNTGDATPPYSCTGYESTAYLTLKNNKLVDVAQATIKEEFGPDDTVKDRITYSNTQNGKSKDLSKKEYDNFIKSFESKGVTDIIYGNAGSPTFVNSEKNVKVVQAFLDKMDKIFVKK